MSAQILYLHDQAAPESSTPASAEAPVAASATTAELIDAYWDDVAERVRYVHALLNAGRFNESLTLCATYLEAVAHALVRLNATPDEGFADELEEHASDPYLTLIHPLQLVRAAEQMPDVTPTAIRSLQLFFPGPDHTLLLQEQARTILHATLSPSEAAVVERGLWKGTIAYIVYDFVRGQSFRRREGERSVGLGAAFHEGPTSHGLSVPELVALLESMVMEARARSHARGMLPEA